MTARVLVVDDILANVVAEAPQALFERLDEMERLLPGGDHEEAHPVDPSGRLLRAGRKRPSCRHTYQRDERAPPHVECPGPAATLSRIRSQYNGGDRCRYDPFSRLTTNRPPAMKR